ncbi:MAG: dihydroorotase [Saprospiraceae bacterium]|nr:dihydroorotase [Saprospiraceae bacterium]
MEQIILKNGRIINEGNIIEGDILISGGRIRQVGGIINQAGSEIRAEGKYLIPGIIDDQVHFREPGFTHKADIFSESRAALAGGITSYMEMPNTFPPATTVEKLEEKYTIASQNSWTNYSFFMGTTNENFDEIQKVDYAKVCGVKIFMGSSTGDMLVDNESTLEKIFRHTPALIATHCEDEATIKKNMATFSQQCGDALNASHHPQIRSVESCLLSSSLAVDVARANNTRLHILHISTQDELALFDAHTPLAEKRITAEVCVHHLFFTADDYARFGNQIKCNPAIKDNSHAPLLLKGLLDGKIDVIATDHAPHTWEEKMQPYTKAPAGLPLVQHSLNIMMDFVQKGQLSIEQMVEKMCHNPAICFRIQERGFLREDYFADIVVIDPEKEWKVEKDNILYKAGWSPLDGQTFKGKVENVLINGQLVFNQGTFSNSGHGRRLTFNPLYTK